MINVSQLTKRFGNQTVVDNLTFSVERGEVLGFLGPNGAGKSTTMKMISGFLKPDHGSVEIEGLDIETNPIEAKSKLGYLPEGIPLYGDMPVHSFLIFAARIRGLSGSNLTRQIASVVSDVQIEDVLTQPIFTLSKGFKRRVGLALALLHDPAVLVLDEPTDGLDPNQKEQVRALIEKISENKVIILSTHILDEVDSVCSRVIIIDKGQIIVDQTPESLVTASKFHNSVRVQMVDINPAEVLKQLSGIDAIANLQYIEKDKSFHLTAKDGRSVVEELWKVVESNDWKIRTLSEERGDLEDVFRQITSH